MSHKTQDFVCINHCVSLCGFSYEHVCEPSLACYPQKDTVGSSLGSHDDSYPLLLTPDCRHITTSRSVKSYGAPSLWMNAKQKSPQGFSVFSIPCSGSFLNLNSVLSRSAELMSTLVGACLCLYGMCMFIYICACASTCIRFYVYFC